MNPEHETFQCVRCGKRFTKFGRQAEILCELQNLIAEYRGLINDPDLKIIKITTLQFVEAEAKCCDRPFMLHTYHNNGD